MIERVLDRRGIEYKSVGHYAQVRCLSPDHEDKNPSMFINKLTGWANCRSCGASYNIFQLFNEKPNWIQIQKEKFREKLRKTAFDSNYLEIPEEAVFFSSGFRGISPRTIQEFQGFQTPEYPGYLFFPLRGASDRIVNFIGRDTTGTRNPKYLFLHKVPVLMAPVRETQYGSIILVEGWFDFLNLYDKGLKNVRCVFGTNSFHQEHVERLKVEGISEVIILFDGDTAGEEGAKEVRKLLEEEFISNKIIKLPSGTDPGDMSEESVLKLKELLYGKSSYSGDQAQPKQLQS